MQIFPFNWEPKILFIQLIKHSSDLLIPHKGNGFLSCVWDVSAGTWCFFTARMLSSYIHWELPAQNQILYSKVWLRQSSGFCKKRKELGREMTFCGHVLCLWSRRVIYPWKILICIPEGLLLWETWHWGFFERLESAQVGAGGVTLGGESDRLLRGFHSPVKQLLKVWQALQSPVFVLFRNPRKPYFIPTLPDTPNSTTNSRGRGQFSLQKCQRFCLNSCSPTCRSCPVGPGEDFSIWSLGTAISWGFCSSCRTPMNVTRREVTPIWQLVSWSRNQSCWCDFMLQIVL